MTIDSLLQDVHHRMAVLYDSEAQFANRLAPRFRLFNYLRNDEYGLSRCIADLLDPEGTHGQGSLFLDDFLEKLGASDRFGSEQFQDAIREYRTSEDRRIDILLRFSNGLIGIENKPWAADQQQQLADYAAHLENHTSEDRSWILVYLSNREPSSNSISEVEFKRYVDDRTVLRLTFFQIQHWMKECGYRVAAPGVRFFVEELADYVKREINGELNMTQESEVISVIRSSDNHLVAATDIVRSWKRFKVEMATEFHRQLEDAINSVDLRYQPDPKDALSAGSSRCGFEIDSPENELGIRLRFEFDTANHHGLFFGILPKKNVSGERDKSSFSQIRDALQVEFLGGSKNQYWIWSLWADDPQALGEGFRDWNHSAKPWIAIQNNELAQRVVELSERIFRTLRKNGIG